MAVSSITVSDWIEFASTGLAFGIVLFTFLGTRFAKPLIDGLVKSASDTSAAMENLTTTLRESLKEQTKQIASLIKAVAK